METLQILTEVKSGRGGTGLMFYLFSFLFRSFIQQVSVYFKFMFTRKDEYIL